MATSTNLNGFSPSRPARLSEDELRAVYGIQALLERRIVTKNSKNCYHFRPRLGSKTIMKALEEGITKFPELHSQFSIAIGIHRPNLRRSFRRLVARHLKDRSDMIKAMAYL